MQPTTKKRGKKEQGQIENERCVVRKRERERERKDVAPSTSFYSTKVPIAL